jgi:hypothetical protein
MNSVGSAEGLLAVSFEHGDDEPADSVTTKLIS